MGAVGGGKGFPARRFVFALVLTLVGAIPGRAAVERENAWQAPARYEIEYRVDASSLAVADGQRLRLWIPMPSDGEAQRVIESRVDAAWGHRITKDGYGNRMAYLEGAGRPERDLVLRYVIERRPSRGMPPGAIEAGGPDDPQRYLKAPRLIPLGGLISHIASAEARGLKGNEEKVWAFYDYVYRTMRYDKRGEGWGRGDAVWACTRKRGNCTDFHSLFIGLALSQQIPARFLIGLPIAQQEEEGDIAGYHCWAEYYDDARGWIPLDASDARESRRKSSYFGALPNDRIELSVGRDLTLEPAQEGEPLNFFFYPYAEVDGKALDGVVATFHFKRLA